MTDRDKVLYAGLYSGGDVLRWDLLDSSLYPDSSANAAPTCAIATPSASFEAVIGVETEVTGTWSDPEGQSCTVEVYLGATKLGDATVGAGTWTYAWTPTAEQVGTASLTAVVTDPSEATGTSSAVVGSVLPTPIVVTLTSPANLFTVVAGTAKTFAGAVTGASAVELWGSLNGSASSKIGDCTVVGSDWSYDWTATDEQVGTWTDVQAKAGDATSSSIEGWVSPSGLVFAIESDRGITLVDDNVTLWSDQSGLGNHASQSTPGLCPVVQTNPLNDLPGLYFDGTKYMVLGNPASLRCGEMTEIIVTTCTNSSGYHAPGINGTATNYDMYCGPGVPNVILNRTSQLAANSGSFSVNTLRCIGWTTSAAGDSTIFNKTTAVGGPTATGAPTASANKYLGTRGDLFTRAYGYVHAVLVFNRALTAPEYASVVAYLGRWGTFA
jgi:hypothetical protein